MPNNAVAFVLTSAEAHALFDAATLGLSERAASGIAGNDKVAGALQKIEHQMGPMSKVKNLVSGSGAVRAYKHTGRTRRP